MNHCNGNNHSLYCKCGFGGEGHLGKQTFEYYSPYKYDLRLHSYDSYVNPNAHCPVCHEPCFFYQSPNGGRVFFDALGPPWPKHPCTDKSFQSVSNSNYLDRSNCSIGYDWQMKGWEPYFCTSIEQNVDGWFKVTGESFRHVLYVRSQYYLVSGWPVFVKQINSTFGLYQLATLRLNPDTLEPVNVYIRAYSEPHIEVKSKLSGRLSEKIINKIIQSVCFASKERLSDWLASNEEGTELEIIDNYFVDIVSKQLEIKDALTEALITSIVALYRAGFTQFDDVLRLISKSWDDVTLKARAIQPASTIIDRLFKADVFGILNNDANLNDQPNKQIHQKRWDARAYVRCFLGFIKSREQGVNRLLSSVLQVKIDSEARQYIVGQLNKVERGERGFITKEELLADLKNISTTFELFDEAIPIADLVTNPDFPYCADGRVVRIKNITGRLIAVSRSDRFYILDFANNQKREFVTSYVVSNFRN